MRQKPVANQDAAEAVALQALGFLAGDGDRLSRFLALTGTGPAELRARAGDPVFLAGVLEHLLGDETLLLVFATEAAIPPATVAAAHDVLTAGESRRVYRSI